jgi:hypothetical protein
MSKMSQVQWNWVFLILLFIDFSYTILQCTCPDTWEIKKEIPVSAEETGTTDAWDDGEALSTGEHLVLSVL